MKYIFKANYVSDKNKYYFVKIKNIKKKYYNYVMNHIRISKISFGSVCLLVEDQISWDNNATDVFGMCQNPTGNLTGAQKGSVLWYNLRWRSLITYPAAIQTPLKNICSLIWKKILENCVNILNFMMFRKHLYYQRI